MYAAWIAWVSEGNWNLSDDEELAASLRRWCAGRGGRWPAGANRVDCVRRRHGAEAREELEDVARAHAAGAAGALTRLGLRDADFNVAWHINDGTDASSMFLKLDLNAYDPCVDTLSAPAEWAWYLEEPPPVLAEDAQEAPPPAIDAQLVGRTVGACASKPGGAAVVNDGC